MASDLRPAELFKYDWRVDVFLEKYRTKKPFLTVDKRSVVLLPQKHIMKLVEKRDAMTLNKQRLVTTEGEGVAFSDLQKTQEFGGRGGSASTTPTGEAVHGFLHRMHHLDETYKLDTPTASERGELMVLQDINQYIANMESSIDVSIGGKIIKNVYGANKVAGTPKADIVLVAFNTRKKKFENGFEVIPIVVVEIFEDCSECIKKN